MDKYMRVKKHIAIKNFFEVHVTIAHAESGSKYIKIHCIIKVGKVLM